MQSSMQTMQLEMQREIKSYIAKCTKEAVIQAIKQSPLLPAPVFPGLSATSSGVSVEINTGSTATKPKNPEDIQQNQQLPNYIESPNREKHPKRSHSTSTSSSTCSATKTSHSKKCSSSRSDKKEDPKHHKIDDASTSKTSHHSSSDKHHTLMYDEHHASASKNKADVKYKSPLETSSSTKQQTHSQPSAYAVPAGPMRSRSAQHRDRRERMARIYDSFKSAAKTRNYIQTYPFPADSKPLRCEDKIQSDFIVNCVFRPIDPGLVCPQEPFPPYDRPPNKTFNTALHPSHISPQPKFLERRMPLQKIYPILLWWMQDWQLDYARLPFSAITTFHLI